MSPSAKVPFLFLFTAAITLGLRGQSASHLFPTPNATDVCPDTPLRIDFGGVPTLGSAGKIHILDADTGADVETIDVSSKTALMTIGGVPNFKYYPVIVVGTQAFIYPKDGALTFHKHYQVRVDGGVFTGMAALPEAAANWKFSTKDGGPTADKERITVAADGTGDFCTVQGALDSLPEGNSTPTTIFIKKGTYRELICFAGKNAVSLVGEDRKQTVIEYSNNANFNNAGGNPYAPGAVRPPQGQAVRGLGYHRGVFLARGVNDLSIANLTIRDTTPQGGSQSEAIILDGNTSSRAIITHVDLYSYQDTLQINGQAYLSDCYIEGDVDFMWGKGPCFFENCECKSLRSSCYYTQIRNPGTNHGFVYLKCTFDGTPGMMGNYLSRIEPSRFPHSEVALMDCVMTTAVSRTAWLLQGSQDPAEIHFWEYNSHDPAGNPVDVSLRMAGSRQLSDKTDAEIIKNYSSPTFVLGNGWDPKSAPIMAALQAIVPARPSPAVQIVVQPKDQLALLGTSPYFVVKAQGGGALHYQWRKDGDMIPGANGPTLRFENAAWVDEGNYAVDVSSDRGTTESDSAELTIVTPAGRPAPKLPSIPSAVFPITSFGAIADAKTDNTLAIQKAIAAASAAGGGIVSLPAAPLPYLSGPIVLQSKINFQIDPGATLEPLPYSPQEKPPAGSYPLAGERYANFITANGAHDVAITGGGTIDGNGAPWWKAFFADHDMPHRPFLVRLDRCSHVLVSGLTLRNSPMFHVALGGIEQLTVFGLTVQCPVPSPNTDGVDPSGSHQLIQNCVISCGDDNIAVKAGGAFCTDLTIADCAFGEGHGVSVGGQSNQGLDGMTVRNCTFRGTTSGLRLKADPTEGGPVKNVSYTNIDMENVLYPIAFYSYYKPVGNPGATGKNQTTPEKVKSWNAKPPNSLKSKTLPTWKAISVSNLTATGTTGYSIIWGLPLAEGFVDSVKLNNVKLLGGPGTEIYDATNVEVTGASDIGQVTSWNALAIIQQPKNAQVAPGSQAVFGVTAAGGASERSPGLSYQWKLDGAALVDGQRPDGATISGVTGPTLTISRAQSAEAGSYSASVSAKLDTFDVARGALTAEGLPSTVTSSSGTLTLGAR